MSCLHVDGDFVEVLRALAGVPPVNTNRIQIKIQFTIQFDILKIISVF